MSYLNITTLSDGRRAVIIRTSDRIAFKACRRKWAFSSHLKGNLAPKQLAAPLWFGSAIHYALEDYHGYNYFGRPSLAFKAYCQATAQNWKRDLPPDAQEHYQLGVAIMDYYVDKWLEGYPREPDRTYWAKNQQTGALEPQVEVNFEIPVPIQPGSLIARYCEAQGIDCVLYRGTIDRVGIDDFGQLWVIEYKTAKVMQSTHFATDPQVSTYVWATELIYDRPVAGVIYQQFGKKMPKGPPLLSSGKFSTAQNLVTSYPLYKECLENMYGDVMKAPSLNQAFLNRLIASENENRDRYIIREPIHRNAAQSQHEAQKILLELEDILNPDLPLYPNPTRDCTRMCSFLTPCVNMDDGSDWEGLIEASYSSRDNDLDRLWRSRLPTPEILKLQMELGQEPDLTNIQLQSAEAYRAAEIAAGEYPTPEWMEATGEENAFAGMNEKGSFNMKEVS